MNTSIWPPQTSPTSSANVVVQLVLDIQRLARVNRFARLPERIVFVAAAADRADRAAVRVDEHLGADALRGRPRGRGDRDERDLLSMVECLGQRGKDFWFT
jgi:hypothetical protein